MFKIVALVIVLAFTAPAIAQNRTVEVLKTNEWMQLPEELQAVYIMGIVDGMAYVMYNSDNPDHDAWVACVQADSVQSLVDATTLLVAEDDEFQGLPLSYAVSTAIGKRRPC